MNVQIPLIGGEAETKPYRRTDGVAEESDLRAETTAPAELSKSEIFDILRNGRRRAAMAYLLAEKRVVSIPELTEYVATAEYGVPAEELSSEQYKRIYTGLYQCHLPRLDEFNVIDFDKEPKTVTLRESAAQVEPYLDRSGRSNSAHVELAIAVVVTPLVLFGVSGVGPFSGTSAILWVVITALALFGMAFFQLHEVPSSSA